MEPLQTPQSHRNRWSYHKVQLTTQSLELPQALATPPPVVKRFWAAESLTQALTELEHWPAADAFTELIRQGVGADAHYRQHRPQTLGEACTHSEFVIRALRQCIEMTTARVEGGLTLLASVGSTAPFVWLFGTVRGIYHALIQIGMKCGHWFRLIPNAWDGEDFCQG